MIRSTCASFRYATHTLRSPSREMECAEAAFAKPTPTSASQPGLPSRPGSQNETSYRAQHEADGYLLSNFLAAWRTCIR